MLYTALTSMAIMLGTEKRRISEEILSTASGFCCSVVICFALSYVNICICSYMADLYYYNFFPVFFQ